MGSPHADLDVKLGQLEGVRELAISIRQIFERILVDSIGTAETAGTCLHACVLLAQAINKFTPATAIVCGGGPPMDGGLMDPKGILRGHYWILIRCADDSKFIVDITADQFGYTPIVILPLEQALLRYCPGDPAVIAQHVTELLQELRLGQS